MRSSYNKGKDIRSLDNSSTFQNLSEVTTNSEDNANLSTCKLTLYTETK